MKKTRINPSIFPPDIELRGKNFLNASVSLRQSRGVFRKGARIKKQILVAGGAGFLGYHLCERLLKEGAMVLCIDNLATGNRKTAEIFEKSEWRKNFRFIRRDITQPLPFFDIDEIYNLACPASPVWYQKDPVGTIRASFLGTLNLLELSRLANAKLLQASTSEIYGDPQEHPQKETYWGNVNPIGPRACYDEGKRAAETLCMDYCRQYGVPVRIARIFNTYGPRMRPNDGRVISNFIMQSLHHKPLAVYGDGSQTRSFCFVDDLIDGLVRLMASDYTQPVNLGNPKEYAIIEIAQKIIALTNSKSKIIAKPLPEDDPKQRMPDIALAKEVLDWRPTTFLEDGLKKTINYFTTLIYK